MNPQNQRTYIFNFFHNTSESSLRHLSLVKAAHCPPSLT